MPKTKRSVEDKKLDCYLSSSDNLEDELPMKPEKSQSQWLMSSSKPKKVHTVKDKKSTSSAPAKNKALSIEIEDEEEQAEKPLDDGNMMTIMSLLGMDYEKSVLAKKKKLDHYTDAVIEKHQAKVEKVVKAQWDKHNNLLDEFQRSSAEVMDQWEKDMQSAKDQEVKIRKQFEQQLKSMQQVIGQESMRVASLRKIQAAFKKAQEDMEKKQKEETSTLNAELRKEMEKVHKKMTQENARQALVNARNSLLQDF